VPADTILYANVFAAILQKKVVQDIFPVWHVTPGDFELPDSLVLDSRLPMHSNRGQLQVDTPGVAALRAERTRDSVLFACPLAVTRLERTLVHDLEALLQGHSRLLERSRPANTLSTYGVRT